VAALGEGRVAKNMQARIQLDLFDAGFRIEGDERPARFRGQQKKRLISRAVLPCQSFARLLQIFRAQARQAGSALRLCDSR
jgi:hypothetical protein